jgi:Na+-translocating ferredoxin:NAD+ oxidoreductase RnfC subunit
MSKHGEKIEKLKEAGYDHQPAVNHSFENSFTGIKNNLIQKLVYGKQAPAEGVSSSTMGGYQEMMDIVEVKRRDQKPQYINSQIVQIK